MARVHRVFSLRVRRLNALVIFVGMSIWRVLIDSGLAQNFVVR
jgi:hypothetical protein